MVLLGPWTNGRGLLCLIAKFEIQDYGLAPPIIGSRVSDIGPLVLGSLIYSGVILFGNCIPLVCHDQRESCSLLCLFIVPIGGTFFTDGILHDGAPYP
jgi:hypothetical protein